MTWVGAVAVGGASITVEVVGDPPRIDVAVEAPIGDSDAEWASVFRNVAGSGAAFAAIGLDGLQALELVRVVACAVDVWESTRRAAS